MQIAAIPGCPYPQKCAVCRHSVFARTGTDVCKIKPLQLRSGFSCQNGKQYYNLPRFIWSRVRSINLAAASWPPRPKAKPNASESATTKPVKSVWKAHAVAILSWLSAAIMPNDQMAHLAAAPANPAERIPAARADPATTPCASSAITAATKRINTATITCGRNDTQSAGGNVTIDSPMIWSETIKNTTITKPLNAAADKSARIHLVAGAMHDIASSPIQRNPWSTCSAHRFDYAATVRLQTSR